MRVTLAQLNPIVGDIKGNLAKLEAALELADDVDSNLLILPELFITGYPPKDLLEREWFIESCQAAQAQVCKISLAHPRVGIIVGLPIKNPAKTGRGLYNAALLFQGGELLFSQAKSLLPTYDVFDEGRYFDPSDKIEAFDIFGARLGITICEDGWGPQALPARRLYEEDPIAFHARKLKVDLIINISASPFEVGKEAERFSLFQRCAKDYKLPLIIVNQVGGNDELIFNGASFALDSAGRPIEVLPSFQEAVVTIDMNQTGDNKRRHELGRLEEIRQALILGVSDYFKKTAFKKALIGLSGGIDSALTCAIAVQALGAENVTGVLMPGPFSSQGSLRDARVLAENLGIDYKIIPISEIYQVYLKSLEGEFRGLEANEAEENIQARIRGNILMALSNKFGYLVLATGNKSEMAVGYSTLYGDMSGGLSVISDLTKATIYELAAYINKGKEIIPVSSIIKPPSAELKLGQTDQDSLPPYDLLDAILKCYIDEGLSKSEIVKKGFNEKTVDWVVKAVARSEHKRWQAPPGLKLTGKSFGSGRRMPIAAKYDLS